MSDFSRKETAMVRRGFDAIQAHLDTRSHKHAYDWRAAFKLAARECSSRDWARALMVSSWYDGYTSSRDWSVADLYALREDCRLAFIIGADCQRFEETARAWRMPQTLAAVVDAIGVKTSATQRRFERVSNGKSAS